MARPKTSTQRDLLFLSETIQAADEIVRLSEGATAESLQADERTLDAVLWNFTVLGAACNQFSQDDLLGLITQLGHALVVSSYRRETASRV